MKTLIVLPILLFVLGSCSDDGNKVNRDDSETPLKTSKLWVEADPDDLADIPREMKNLFTLRSPGGNSLAWGQGANIDREALETAGGADGWINRIVEGTISSGLSIEKQTTRKFDDGEVRRVLFAVPPESELPASVFMSFFAVRGRAFTAIGIFSDTAFDFEDQAVVELFKIADQRRNDLTRRR